MKTIIPILLCGILACSREAASPVLVRGFAAGEEVTRLSELTGKNYTLTPLETSREALVGRVNKIVKRAGTYYILCDDRAILAFDAAGKYLSRFDKAGRGAGEYLSIGDFTVRETGGTREVWLCDDSTIKIYDAATWSFRRSIDYPFVVNKFHVIDDNTILLMTGQNDRSLTLSDTTGAVLATFLPKEFPFLTFRAVQFQPFPSRLLFPLGVANAHVYYDLETRTFGEGRYVDDPRFLSRQGLKTLFDTEGYNYLASLRDQNLVRHASVHGGKIVIAYTLSGVSYLGVWDKGKLKLGKCSSSAAMKDDLTGQDNLTFTRTLGFADSDDSLLLHVEALNASGVLATMNIQEGDNPVLLDIFL
jgi:hypothetical protein